MNTLELEKALLLQEEQKQILTDIVPPDIITEFESAQAKKAKAKRTCNRPYCFSLITYVDIQVIDKYLRSATWIQHWSYTTHCYDTWTAEDEKANKEHKCGTLKGIHTHILIYTFDGKTQSAVKKNFDRISREHYTKLNETPQNTLCQVCTDALTMYRYQLHLDNPDKYKYDVSDRFVDDIKYWSKFEKTEGSLTSENKCFAIVNMMLSGVPYYKLVELYGRDFVYHISSYKEVCLDIKEQRHCRLFDGQVLWALFERCLANSEITEHEKYIFAKVFAFIDGQLTYQYNT